MKIIFVALSSLPGRGNLELICNFFELILNQKLNVDMNVHYNLIYNNVDYALKYINI